MEISDSSSDAVMMEADIVHHTHNHTDDEDSSVYSAGMVPDMMWKIREDCERLMANYNESEELYCPPTFDGWSCWNATPAGRISVAPCPYFITGFDPQRMAHKVCTEEGTWFRHPQSNLIWSNYTTCVDVEDLEMRQAIVNVYIAGYSVSLIALVISLAILIGFRQSLKCTRIYIHRNLFASFIINNAMWLLWYKGVADQPEVLLDNRMGCKILHVLLHYFLVSNYFWMFCEGLYLHTVLVVAFLSENSIMKWFHLIGWALPAAVTATYAGVRASIPEETNHCWMEESRSTWILSGPVCLSMLTNAFFLVNIVRVLVTKLKAPNTTSYNVPPHGHRSSEAQHRPEMRIDGQRSDEVDGRTNGHVPALTHSSGTSSHRTSTSLNGLRKAVRATLILLPLLGLHYVVMPFRPEAGAPGEIAYQIVSAIFTSFQGLCVAFLFCFCNGEVLKVLRKEIVRYAATRKVGLQNRRLILRSQQPMTTEL
ncbi:putative DH31 receptor [Daphnia sinensis]|uniref:DH31 receptor n=1 Tax=Daphnia sinensis TaxID=1820382 RepID=A0AAD5KPB9_9CRUS|nr:putative DH31 receptor [Daphnia sinensis]